METIETGTFAGTWACIRCGQDLREVGCCCDEGTYVDGSHRDGTCPVCCPTHRYKFLPNYATDEEQTQFLALTPRLRAAGYTAIYGGGKASKGHGYWIQKDGQTVHNDGRKSGNPAFWMYDDLLTLLEGE